MNTSNEPVNVAKWFKTADGHFPPESDPEVLIFSKKLQAEHTRKLKPMAAFYSHKEKKFKSYGDHDVFLDSIEISHWTHLPENPED